MAFAHARAAAVATSSARRKSKIQPRAPARPERGGLEIEDTTCCYSIPVDAGEGRYRDGDRDTKVTGGTEQPLIDRAERRCFLQVLGKTNATMGLKPALILEPSAALKAPLFDGTRTVLRAATRGCYTRVEG